MKHPGKTPPFRGLNGGVLPGSISEIGHFRLGGVDQWVMNRGESLANPLLVLLHGGRALRRCVLLHQAVVLLARQVEYVLVGQCATDFVHNAPDDGLWNKSFGIGLLLGIQEPRGQ